MLCCYCFTSASLNKVFIISCWPSSLFNGHWCYSLRGKLTDFCPPMSLQRRLLPGCPFLCENKSFFWNANICSVSEHVVTHGLVLKLFVISTSHQMWWNISQQATPQGQCKLTCSIWIFDSFQAVVLWRKVILSTKMEMYMWGNEIRILHTHLQEKKNKLKGPQCIPQRLSVHYASSSCSKDILN